MLLGPGMNIKRSPLCGRSVEYFFEDPYLSGQLAGAYVRGLQGKGIAACPRHFAANNQETLRMSGSSQVDERTLHEIYLSAFEDKDKLTDAESLTVTCKVKNTGTCTRKEVVQLYVRDEQSRVNRPVRELKGFEKVELAPGEETTVSFTLGKKAFAYYEPIDSILFELNQYNKNI